MLNPWVDDLTVLLWPWGIGDGGLPPASRRRRKHRRGDPRDQDQADQDHQGGDSDRDTRRPGRHERGHESV